MDLGFEGDGIKGAPIAALRQTKFYLPRQAAAATEDSTTHALRLLQYTRCRSRRDNYVNTLFLYCGDGRRRRSAAV